MSKAPDPTDAQVASLLEEEAVFGMEGPIINRARRLVEAYRDEPAEQRPYTYEWAWAVFQLAAALEAAGVDPVAVHWLAEVDEET